MLTTLARYCPYCKLNRLESAFTLSMPAQGVYMCDICYESHGKLLDALAGGEPPQNCQICGRPFWEKESCYMQHVDGIYQLLCKGCSDAYAKKRSDLYRATPFGEKMKI